MKRKEKLANEPKLHDFVASSSKLSFSICLATLMILVSQLICGIQPTSSESAKTQQSLPTNQVTKPSNGSDPPSYIATGRKISKILDDFFHVSLTLASEDSHSI